jgi:hypothetical protein
MLKAYIYKNFISHVLNQAIGGFVLVVFSYLAIKHPEAVGIKDQYDILNSMSDFLLLVSLFLLLGLALIQFIKGYLLYIPSTYISFDSEGVAFKRFGRKYRFIKWQEIEVIDLEIESEWLLNVLIKDTKGGTTKVELSELWALSITKKWCVHYNFLKLAALANKNSSLMGKLVPDQMETLYNYSGVS